MVIVKFDELHSCSERLWVMIESAPPALHARVWQLGAFDAERRREDGTWEAIEKTTWGNSYAHPLLLYLLCSSCRRAARSEILDDLWPNTPFS
jgi:hypothetical protein